MDELYNIQSKIYVIRGQRVMLDFDLANIYQVETKYLKRQVRRNMERFEGDDFMFEVTQEEILRCQNVTSSWGGSREDIRNEMNEILADQNDINESTRAQLDAISTALAELQASRSQIATLNKRRPIGFIQPKDDDGEKKQQSINREQLALYYSIGSMCLTIMRQLYEQWSMLINRQPMAGDLDLKRLIFPEEDMEKTDTVLMVD